MRKNFFKKKLASTLALAMVVTSLAVPTSASAATATKVVKQGGGAAPAVLYVGDKGTDYGLSKTFKGNKYTWTISNSAIATINKSGVVTAKAPGTVTVKVTARNAKGKWLAAFTHKVKVNLRATSVDIGADDFTLVMGQEKDLNAVKTPAKSTDALKYVSDNTAVATVNAKTGVVKTVGVGEATITVLSKAVSTSADTSKYNKKDTVKVTVVDGIQSIKQTTPTKLEVTFATDQSKKLTSSDLTITDADGVKQIIKSLDFSADGKTATVGLYVELSDSVVYKVVYGTTDKTFTASKGEVASVVLEGKTVQYAKPTGIGVKLLDKNGVDVTNNTALQYVTFEYDNSEAYIGMNSDNDGYEINVYNFPKAVSVTATYHTYKYVDAVETTYKASAVFNSVEEIKNTAKDIVYTVASTNNGPDWTAVKTSVPATAFNYKVYIKATDVASGDDLTEANFGFETSDANILTVSSDGTIYPIKAGSAYVKATYGATTRMLAVTIGSEAKVAQVTPSTNSVTLYYVKPVLDSAGNVTKQGYWVDGSKSITFDAKDQYGDIIPAGSDVVDPELLSSNKTKNASNAFTVDPSGDTVTFTADSVNDNNDGTYNFRVTYKNRPVTVTVKVVQVTNRTITSVQYSAGNATLDAAVTASTDGDEAKTLTLHGYNSSGQQVANLSTGEGYINDTTNLPLVDGNGDPLADKVSFKVTLDGDAYAGSAVVTGTGIATKVIALDFPTTGNIATQSATGTYAIKATYDGKYHYTSTVVVKNSQTAPTVKLVDSSITEGNTYLETVKEAFTAKLGGTELEIIDATVVIKNRPVDPADIDSVSTTKGNNITVKKIVVAQPIVLADGTEIIVHRTINVDRMITIVE